MPLIYAVITIAGLCLFEVISSIDNAIVNAEVLDTLKPKARKWFLVWGLVIAVFIVRALLPWIIVWAASPNLGPLKAVTATFSNDESTKLLIENNSPILLIGGGTFLLFLFLYWLFVESKRYAFRLEKFFKSESVWFYATASLALTIIVGFALARNPIIALGSMIGATVFFITQGLKQNAQRRQKKLTQQKGTLSDRGKILYLEVLDATFSIDGVIGAFAFTLSVPLILLGNGLGALIVRKLTIKNIEVIKKYIYLKNGAMYSILLLSFVMICDGFGITIPSWVTPLFTFMIVGYFFKKSYHHSHSLT